MTFSNRPTGMDWKDDLKRYENYLTAKGAKPRYITTAKTYLRNLGERFDKRYLEITRQELEAWFAGLRKHGIRGDKGLADSTLHSTVGRVRACLRFLNYGLTPDSIRGLSYGKQRKRIRGNDELLTDEEIKELGNVLPHPWKATFLLLAHTGARPSEVLSLKVDDIDGPLTENGATFLIIRFRETKTDKPRESTIFDLQAIQIINEFVELIAPQSGFLFPNREGRPSDPHSYRATLKRTAKRLGWTKKVFPYLTRHSYVTKLRELGIPDSDIMQQVGFVDNRMLQTYGHPKAEALRKRMAKMLAPEPLVSVNDFTQADLDQLAEEQAILKEQVRDLGEGYAQIAGLLAGTLSPEELEFLREEVAEAKLRLRRKGRRLPPEPTK